MKDLLKVASIQKLCDFLGYDEGKVYYGLLHKEKEAQKYSHSKSYRILKSLYNSGAAAKVNDIKKEKDFFSYILLPPTFLCAIKDIQKEIIKYLENIYLKNYGEVFANAHLQLSLKQGNQNFLFYLENYMKSYAIVIHGGDKYYPLYKKYLPVKDFEKIIYICRKDQSTGIKGPITVEPHLIGNRRAILIDGRIVAEFFRFPKEEGSDIIKPQYSGYYLSKDIKTKTNKGEISYIKQVEEELRRLFSLNF